VASVEWVSRRRWNLHRRQRERDQSGISDSTFDGPFDQKRHSSAGRCCRQGDHRRRQLMSTQRSVRNQAQIRILPFR
jgi:hypothetical protein